jgi:hypothetical protein
MNATVGNFNAGEGLAGVRSDVRKGYTLDVAHATVNSIFKRGCAILSPRVNRTPHHIFVVILKDRDGKPRQRLVCGFFRQ